MVCRLVPEIKTDGISPVKSARDLPTSFQTQFYFMCISVLPGFYVSVPHVCLVPEEAREDVRFPETGVTYCCELNPGPLHHFSSH